MEFLRSFHRRHLAGKPVVASPNVGCFLRLAQLKTRVTQFKRTAKPSSTLGVPLLVRWPEQWYGWLVELNLTFKSGRLQKRTARWTLKSRLNQGLHCWWRHFVQAVMLKLHPEPLWTRLAMALGIGGHLLKQKAPKFIFSFETTPEKSAYNWPWNRQFWDVILKLPIKIKTHKVLILPLAQHFTLSEKLLWNVALREGWVSCFPESYADPVSLKQLTYPSPHTTFCPKWEITFRRWVLEGVGEHFPRISSSQPKFLTCKKSP